MKKKLLKKINILNQNIYIKNYSNYLIYNYLNNLNLKLFFYYFKNKKYYFKNIKNIKFNLNKNIWLKKKILNQCIYIKNNTFYNNSNFNKFYNNKNKFNYLIYKNKLTNSNIKTNQIIYNSNINYYINSNNNMISINNWIYNIYIELFSILFIVNMVKVLELYKICNKIIYLTILKI